MKTLLRITSITILSTILLCCKSQNEKIPGNSLPLSGQQMVAMGNSITAPKDSWAWVTAQYFDMELTNLAVSGATWTDTPQTTVDTDPAPVYDNNVISNQVFRFLQMSVPEGTVIP